MLGMTAEQMLLGAVGAADDPSSGGRQMPSHWGSAELHIVSGSSPTGSHYVQSVGCAQAHRYLDPESDEVTLMCSGEGATSEGEFWEAMNAACLENLPLVFLIEDNGYAISVPVEKQTAGGNVAQLLAGFPNLKRVEVDGTDVVASYRAMTEAVAHARARKGPALVHAKVTRPYSHSLSDDERLYKTKAERDAEEARDPVLRVSGVAGVGRNSGPARVAGDRARGGQGDPGSDRPGAARGAAGEGVGAGAFVFGQSGSDVAGVRCRAAVQRATRARWWTRST